MNACAGGVALLLLLAACSAPPEQAARKAILAQMQAAWGRSETPLEAGPVAIDGDHAVADWTQGARGGRALLRRERGVWTTVLCAGDGLRTAEGLIEVGVPAPTARRLAEHLAEAEARLPMERLARMASFAGVMRMAREVGHDRAH